MKETILLPSPNWFQVSILGISRDGWLVYGGPNKSVCVLEPLQDDQTLVKTNSQRYKAHTVFKAHPEKIVSIDITPDWPRKRCFLAGSADGSVKQWTIEGAGKDLKIKSTQSHEFHHYEKEEVTGVGYSIGAFAITVGGFGNIVKWDLQSNVVKANSHYLKNFKPVCMSCSPHLPLHVAVGTKQGVIFVFDFSGPGKLLYKVRGQDDEIVNLSWCPQFRVNLQKTYHDSPDVYDDENIEKQDTQDTDTEIENENMHVSGAVKVENEPEKEIENKDMQTSGAMKVDSGPDNIANQDPITVKLENETQLENKDMQATGSVNILEASGMVKNLPDDSFDEVNVTEDDLFDVYKDHEADEFGHKKYQPEEILVKVKEAVPEFDYLAECMKLKEDILQKKKAEEQTIQSLVEAIDKATIDSDKDASTSQSKAVTQIQTEKHKQSMLKTNDHTHKHLLASIGKYGGVRIWSKSGKLVATCAVPVSSSKNPRNKAPNWPTLLWYKPDSLLIADGKSELLESNPLIIDSKNKLEWRLVHTLHRRGLYCIASEAPRIQVPTEDHWPIWTVSQDRNLVKYCMKTRQTMAIYGSCGGYVYNIQPCPYDAGKIAISVGDGAVRVWQTSSAAEDESKLCAGNVNTYWQNVQGKVLKLAWHPTRENMLAFSTAEARVGIIETGGKCERGARALPPALGGAVYSLCWADGDRLYACGAGQLVLYHATQNDQLAHPVTVCVEGQRWEVSEARWHARALAAGSAAGAVALLQPHPPHHLLAAAHVFSKMIYTIEWHPQQISTSNEESPHKNLIAVCSMDKHGDIAILEFGDKEDNTKQLTQVKMLSGHKGPVHDLKWNPHRDAQLLSTSADGTIKIWDVLSGVSSHVLWSGAAVLCAAWSLAPQHHALVLAGGADYSLTLWDITEHTAEHFDDSQYPSLLNKKEKKKSVKKEPKKKEEVLHETEEQIAATLEKKIRSSRKYLLPTVSKQMNNGKIDGARRLYQKYIAKKGGCMDEPGSFDKQEYELEYLKIFGSIKDVNEILDNEMERHMDTGNFEPWIILSIFRGHIDPMIQFASQRDMLCPYLLSIAPCVSFKYWKDATQLYLSQIDRLVAKGEEDKLSENRSYGGPVYRKVCMLLSVHDVRGAVAALRDAQLYREAYILCRIRYMDSFAEETLKEWASVVEYSGNMTQAAVCYMALENYTQAAVVLGKTKSPECLSLAADLAKETGQALFADHIEKKALTEVTQPNGNPLTDDTTEDTLPDLPSRGEILINENEEDSESVTNEDSGLEE